MIDLSLLAGLPISQYQVYFYPLGPSTFSAYSTALTLPNSVLLYTHSAAADLILFIQSSLLWPEMDSKEFQLDSTCCVPFPPDTVSSVH